MSSSHSFGFEVPCLLDLSMLAQSSGTESLAKRLIDQFVPLIAGVNELSS